jgi:two-component system alkaline phosphatase synthesis response regulator PhoP
MVSMIRRERFPDDVEKVPMATECVLVVDDEEDLLELIRYNLGKEGYQVRCVATGELAIQEARAQVPDVILLDLMLPAVDGLAVCKILKGDARTQNIPIVMVTAKTEEADVVTGLELGADDYITKPFSPRVLIARIRAVLRRKTVTPVDEAATIRMHDMVIHPGRHEVLVGDTPVQLTATEFRVLHVLAGRPGWVFTRYQIANAVHGGDHIVTDRSIDVQIVGLRKKLGTGGRYIETIRGVGYRFKE